jgi:hypothetical protein
MSSGSSSLILLGATPEEVAMLESRGEEIVGYAMATLTDSFSRRRAEKRIERFGFSRATSRAVLDYIETEDSLRKEMAERLLGRAKLAALGCAAATALAFVPAMPKIYVGMIAVGAVY